MNKLWFTFWGLLYLALSALANVGMMYAVYQVFGWEFPLLFLTAYGISAYGAYRAMKSPTDVHLPTFTGEIS